MSRWVLNDDVFHELYLRGHVLSTWAWWGDGDGDGDGKWAQNDDV